jgi:hypothetical protein
MKIINKLLALTLPCLSLGGCVDTTGVKPSPPVALAQPAPVAASSTTSNKLLGVWRDCSQSENEDELEQVIPALTAAIGTHHQQIVGVRVICFANGNRSIFAEHGKDFVWGVAPAAEDCNPDMEKAPPEAKLFKDAKERFIRAEMSQCQLEQTQRAQAYDERVVSQLKGLEQYLKQRPSAIAPCTPFTTLGARMLREALPYNLTITDGWADCRKEKDGDFAGVNIEGNHVILQLTRQHDSQASDDEIPKREAFLRRMFPSSEVVLASSPTKAVNILFK